MPRNTLANNQRSLINPYIYEAEPIDYYSMLSKGFAQQEERKQNAIQQHSVIKQALGKAREQLHQDPDTLMWFDQKANNIEKSINDAAQVGDYAGALNAGLTAAGDLANDASLNARIRSNTQYKEEFERQRQRVGKGISQATFDWWVKNNPYHYEDIKDINGVIIGGNDWQSNFTPVDDLKVDELALRAAQLLKPDKGSYSSSSNQSADKTYSDTTHSSGSQWERINFQDIVNNMDYILMTTPGGMRALEQSFNVAINEKQKLTDEINSLDKDSNERKIKEAQLAQINRYFEDPNTGIGLNDDENGWKTYQARLISDNLVAKGLAYDWRFTDRSDIVAKSITPNGIQSGLVYNPLTGTLEERTITLPGDLAEREIDTKEETEVTNGATSSAGDAMADAEKQAAKAKKDDIRNRRYLNNSY